MDSLYCSRNLLNGDDLIEWAKGQGFKKCLNPEQFHVTIAYSKKKFDWEPIKPKKSRLIIKGGHRSMEVFDQKAVVLKFQSNVLEDRWQMFLDDGASWDFPNYQSHVTISYMGLPKGIEKEDIEPYTGILIFDKEKFEPLNPNWKSTVATEENI